MVSRTCLHCALARALRAEATTLAAGGLAVTLGRSDPVWLPASGARVYRGIRRLLRQAEALALPGPLKLAVVDLPGKSHVEVTATVRRGREAIVLGSTFPRYVPGTLARGFAETLADGV